VIVECPVCRTRYRTDGAGLIEGNTFFECTREDCRHVFPYVPSFLEANTTPQGAGLSLQADSDTVEDESIFQLQDRPVSSRPALTERKQRPPAPSEDMTSFPDPLDELEDFPAPEVPFVTEGEEENSEVDIAPRRERSTTNELSFSLRPFLGFLGILVAGYAALMFYCLSRPEKTEAVLARLPVLGPLFTAERASAQQITLLDLYGSFWLTKDGRRVFAVSGRAVNDAPVPARNIQIEGQLYDAAGKVIGQRVIFCGTETAPAVLERLTVREIGILQNLVPPKQFNIPAGQSANFLIVFPDLPSAPAQFSCRVIAAQFG
jgi:hypothetical protein